VGSGGCTLTRTAELTFALNAQTSIRAMIMTLLSYDFFGFTVAFLGRDDLTFVTSHFGQRLPLLAQLAESHGVTMSAEVFLELYDIETRPADLTDRNRLRRQRKNRLSNGFSKQVS
jgi:hypothetical protein